MDPTDIRLNDIVRMRKPHPCGGTDWRVVRLGADIGLICLMCNHKVLIARGKFIKQVKTFLERGEKFYEGEQH